MTSQEFKDYYTAKGWNYAQLEERWGIKRRRLQQIQGSPEDNRSYWKYAVMGLYTLPENQDTPKVDKYATFTKGQFRKMFQDKGWNADTLATAWGFANRAGLYRLIERNPAVAFDALHGLPHYDAVNPE